MAFVKAVYKKKVWKYPFHLAHSWRVPKKQDLSHPPGYVFFICRKPCIALNTTEYYTAYSVLCLLAYTQTYQILHNQQLRKTSNPHQKKKTSFKLGCILSKCAWSAEFIILSISIVTFITMQRNILSFQLKCHMKHIHFFKPIIATNR